MSEAEFRALALELPEAEEGSHMAHPDFRVRGKIFATLSEEGDYGVVKLTLEQQEEFGAHAGFEPVPGGWGKRGYTKVVLRAARKGAVREALRAAWLNTAPKGLRGELD